MIERGDAGQADERVLRRHVGDLLRIARRRQHRSHVDDRAAARRAHRADLLAQAQEHAVEVDAHDPAPVVERVIADGGMRAADAGVVDRAVEASELLDHGGDHLGHRALLGDVGLDGTGVTADLRRHALGRLPGDVDDRHPGATGGRPMGARLADARAGSGDQDDLAVEVGARGARLRSRSSSGLEPRSRAATTGMCPTT